MTDLMMLKKCDGQLLWKETCPRVEKFQKQLDIKEKNAIF